mgnify:CR=1 FL=1
MEEPAQSSNTSSQNKRTYIILLLTGLALLWLTPFTKIDSLVSPKPLKLQLATSPYLICSINDDPEDYNLHGIYNPTDLAVTVSNLKRLGVSHLFLGTHLHWPELDEFDNNTLRTQLENLDSCIFSVPLRRTSAGIELPPYLLDSSLPISEENGDTSKLPVVNNLSLAPTISIPNNAKVGFSQLETEPANSSIPLLAKWDDRLLLSSLLLERVHQLGGNASNIKIRIGKSILIPSAGLSIPIDEFGYFKPASLPTTTKPHIISSNITNIKKSPLSSHTAILTASGIIADSYRAIDTPTSQLDLLSVTPTIRSSPINFFYSAIILSLLALLLTTMLHLTFKRYTLWCVLLTAVVFLTAFAVARSQTQHLPITPLLLIILLAHTLYWLDQNGIIFAQRDARAEGQSIDFDEVSSGFIAKNYKKKTAKQEAKAASQDRRKERKRLRRERRQKKREG